MLRLTGYELLKILSQKKTYIAAAGHLLLVLLCYVSFKLSKGKFLLDALDRKSNFDFENIANFADGLFFARAALLPTFLIVMPILVSTLAGDSIAGEIQEGTLKLLLARGRSRAKLVISKFLAIYLVVAAYTFYFGLVMIVIGIAFFGISQTQLVFLEAYVLGNDFAITTIPEALSGYCWSLVYFSFSTMALGSVGLFLSSCFDRMTAAAVGCITFYFVCYIVDKLPFTAVVRPYLISNTMDGAFVFHLAEIPLMRLASNLVSLSGYIVVFLLLSIITFRLKDIK